MNIFFLDLWHDLREKRLWPVAVLLAVGILAIPLLLLKAGDSGASRSTAASGKASAAGADATAVLTGAKGAGPSHLDRVKSKNPFHSTEKPKPVGGVITVTGQGAQGGKPSSSGGGSAPADTPASGGTPGTGQPNTQAGQPKTQTPVPKKLTRYAYVADVTFAHNRELRGIRDMKRLRMLPSSTSPLLLYLGVSQDGNSAAFLVDSSLSTAGEGTCRPSGKDCNVVYIGPGAEHEFTDPAGTSYGLRVNEIRKVKITPAKAGSASKRRAKASKHARRGAYTPNLVDLETVESGGGSSSSAGRR